MPFIDRDELGRIVGIYSNQQRELQQFVDFAQLFNPTPNTVTMRQARLALLNAGLLTMVNSAISNMQGIEGEAARIEWEFSSEVHRNKALVKSLAPVLGMTDQQLDQLFIAAASL